MGGGGSAPDIMGASAWLSVALCPLKLLSVARFLSVFLSLSLALSLALALSLLSPPSRLRDRSRRDAEAEVGDAE